MINKPTKGNLLLTAVSIVKWNLPSEFNLFYNSYNWEECNSNFMLWVGCLNWDSRYLGQQNGCALFKEQISILLEQIFVLASNYETYNFFLRIWHTLAGIHSPSIISTSNTLPWFKGFKSMQNMTYNTGGKKFQLPNRDSTILGNCGQLIVLEIDTANSQRW